MLDSMMKIRKGLPPGYMPLADELKPLIERLHELSPQDIEEVTAFVDYLQSGAEQLPEPESEEGRDLKLYDFMQGGISSSLGNDGRAEEQA